MKTLSNTEVVLLVEMCNVYNCNQAKCEKYCPLWKECYYHFTGEKVGSCLEEWK